MALYGKLTIMLGSSRSMAGMKPNSSSCAKATREIPKSQTLISPEVLKRMFLVARSLCKIPLSCIYLVASKICRTTYLTSLKDRSCCLEFNNSNKEAWQNSITMSGSPFEFNAISWMRTILSCCILLRMLISLSKLRGKPPRTGSSERVVAFTATTSFVSLCSALNTLPYAPSPTLAIFEYLKEEVTLPMSEPIEHARSKEVSSDAFLFKDDRSSSSACFGAPPAIFLGGKTSSSGVSNGSSLPAAPSSGVNNGGGALPIAKRQKEAGAMTTDLNS
mmetsp:Transcript_35335/g.64662  ORF Transcript_35335/g.64662 Transcript_35335/m.64662 type:complete len:276 (-) Transcript_35335:23-850(-)